jgi:hypothetical protein
MSIAQLHVLASDVRNSEDIKNGLLVNLVHERSETLVAGDNKVGRNLANAVRLDYGWY